MTFSRTRVEPVQNPCRTSVEDPCRTRVEPVQNPCSGPVQNPCRTRVEPAQYPCTIIQTKSVLFCSQTTQALYPRIGILATSIQKCQKIQHHQMMNIMKLFSLKSVYGRLKNRRFHTGYYTCLFWEKNFFGENHMYSTLCKIADLLDARKPISN